MFSNLSSKQAYAYAEILEIFSLIDEKLVQKIPQRLIKIFQTYATTTYTKHLNKDIPLERQDISPKTASIFTLLALKYWGMPKDEIHSIKLVLTENENILNKELQEKYNTNSLFNNTTVTQETVSEPTKSPYVPEEINDLPLDTTNLPWYKKIIIKFNKLFPEKNKKSNNPT